MIVLNNQNYQFKDKPKCKQAINKKVQCHAQANKLETETSESLISNNSNTNKKKSENKQKIHGGNGDHYQLYQFENMKEWIFFDNKSTVTNFCTPKFGGRHS